MSESTVTRFYVSKMKCDGCITNASNSIKELSGFEKAEFDLSEESAVVYGNVDPQAVCYALGEAGYPAVVRSD